MSTVVFILAVLGAPCAIGLPLTRLSSLRDFTTPARIAIGWAGGTVILTIMMTVFSALGFVWRPWLIAAIATVSIVGAMKMGAPRNRTGATGWQKDWPSTGAALLCTISAFTGLIQFAIGAATSADLSYFWGVKAVHFSIARGLDFQWMQLPHLIHLHPTYPPLWPVSLAWGALVSDSFPWTVVPVVTWVYLIATAFVVHSLLRNNLRRHGALIVTGLWLAVLTGSAIRSFSGGSAEGPLVFFVTVAVTALVIEDRRGQPMHRWLAAGALAGAVLTKSEGAVAAVLVIAGTAIRDASWHTPGVVRSTARLAFPALAAAGLWFAIKVSHGLPLTDPIRESAFVIDFSHLEVTLKVCARLLVPGVLLVGWLTPLAAAATTKPLQPLRALPALLVAGGLPVFAVVYYLHSTSNPVELIVWTFPRLIQPAISAWIVGLGVICLSRPVTAPEAET